MKYYFLSSTTTYDGYEFQGVQVCERKSLTIKQAQKEVEDYHGHNDDCEIVDLCDFKEITKAEYEVLKKYI